MTAGVDRRPASRRQAGSWLWLQGLACGSLAAAAPAAALVLAVLLAPALLAVFLDRDPGRPTARCVVLCALAACIAPLRTFWAEGHGMEAATALVSDPATLGTAWSAAAGGWLLAELTPLAVRLALEASGRLQSARLRAERARLAEEWSPEPPVRETPSG